MVPDLGRICDAIRGMAYNISVHGFLEMESDGITVSLLEHAIGADSPEIVEEYTLDNRGPSCLILGWLPSGEGIHVCMGYGGDKPNVVTVYRPDNRWNPDLRTRRATNE